MRSRSNDYRGPDKELFQDALADYEEARFNVMRCTSIAGKVLADWERRGGNKNDIRDGYALRQMTPEDQQAELRRQYRVSSWLGIVAEDMDGQGTFAKLFEMPAPTKTGIGGSTLGTRLSVVRAMAAGFNDGKTRGGPSLQDGIALYGFEADSEEALSYSQGWGEGFKDRPPPKTSKRDAEAEQPPEGEAEDRSGDDPDDPDDDDDGSDGGADGKSLAQQIDEELNAQAEAPKRGGRRKAAEAASAANVVPMPRGGRKPPLALPAPDAAMPDDVEFDDVAVGPTS